MIAVAAEPTAGDRLAQISRALEGRPLFWFGIRGTDAAPLLDLPEFAGTFCITAQLDAASLDGRSSICLERISGTRVDLDMYDLDLDRTQHGDEFRDRLLEMTSRRCVLVTYRPSSYVSSLGFALRDTLTIAGMFKDRQSAFEHKPWVETELANGAADADRHPSGERRRVRTLGWTYVSDHHQGRARRMLRSGPHVLRTSRDSGGVGVHRVENIEQLTSSWPEQPEHFVAIAPYLEQAVPINLSGCVFPDGTVRLHPPSLQLIGIPQCTDRPFGYCGNDFGAIKQLSIPVLQDLDLMARDVGRWLHSQAYLGAFGLDALIHDGKVYFTEVNPRFQGSSAISATIARRLDLPDLHSDHIAAFLGLDPGGEGPDLVQWVDRQPAIAHAVVHNQASTAVHTEPTARFPRWAALSGNPDRLLVDPGGVLGKVTFTQSVTTTGYSITADAGELLLNLQPGPKGGE